MKKIHWPDINLRPVNLWLLASLPGPENKEVSQEPLNKDSEGISKSSEIKNNIYQSRRSK